MFKFFIFALICIWKSNLFFNIFYSLSFSMKRKYFLKCYLETVRFCSTSRHKATPIFFTNIALSFQRFFENPRNNHIIIFTCFFIYLIVQTVPKIYNYVIRILGRTTNPFEHTHKCCNTLRAALLNCLTPVQLIHHHTLLRLKLLQHSIF